MKIIAKSFPDLTQIRGRVERGVFDGVEIFVMDDILTNPKKYEELVKLARDSFEIVNFETFYFVEVDGSPCLGSLIDQRPRVREKSRNLLAKTVELNNGQGNVNTHFIGQPKTIAHSGVLGTNISREDQIGQVGAHVQQYLPRISLENIIAFSTQEGGRFTYQPVGCDVCDFSTLFREFGIPITLDTAHLALTLEQYRRIECQGHIKTSHGEIVVNLSQNQRSLGRKINEEGLMGTFLNQIETLPYVRTVHFSNCKLESDTQPIEGCVEFSSNQRLLDLNRVLSFLRSNRSSLEVTPEIVEENYSTDPDYINTPYCVGLTEKMQSVLYS